MINTELPLVNDWFRANMLSLNISKTSFILFCSHKKYIPEMTPLIQIDNIPILQTKSVKFLGTQISNKVSKNIGILSRISYKLPAHTLISLYYSLIYPYLAYCNMIWSSNYVTRISHLANKSHPYYYKLPYFSHVSET